MSLIQIQREMDAAFRHGEVEEYHKLLDLFNVERKRNKRARKALKAINEAGEMRRAGRAKGFTVAKCGRVFGKR